MNRREALAGLAGFLAGSPLGAQQDMPYTPARVPPLEDLVNVFEFEPVCKMRLPQQNYDYIAGGVDGEWSLRHNREAFDKYTFRPRILRNVSDLDLSVELYGDRLSFPVLIAPVAGHGLLNPEGEIATARAAAAMETVLIMSTNTSQPLEKVAEAARFPKWFQLYPGPDLEATWERIEHVAQNGYRVLVLTVDAGYNSNRERLRRNRIRTAVPSGVRSPQTEARRRQPEPLQPNRLASYGLTTTLMHRLDWTFFDELKKRWKGPVLIKGILTGEDGALATSHGADGVIVSNHGGRYLEYAPAPIDVLEEVVSAVGGKMPVLVDSGFRRGTDILKGLALGAKAVCVGRPPMWGLAAYGEEGVKRVMEILRTELALSMGHCGRANLAAIDRTLVRVER